MRQLFSLFLLISLLLTFTACYKVQIKAQEPDNVQIVPSGSVSRVRTKKVWYVGWGLFPISDNSTADLLSGAKKVSIETRFTFLDTILMILPVFNSRTIEVKIIE